jgi:hypothetical protein
MVSSGKNVLPQPKRKHLAAITYFQKLAGYLLFMRGIIKFSGFPPFRGAWLRVGRRKLENNEIAY